MFVSEDFRSFVDSKLRIANNLSINFTDDVYRSGKIVRKDHNASSEVGAKVAATLLEVFPETARILSQDVAVVGEYISLRAPYKNSTVSLYEFNRPSEDVLLSYGLDSSVEYGFCGWFGRKYDLISKEVSLKVVLPLDSVPVSSRPPLLGIGNYLAKIYGPHREESKYLDCYGFATADMAKWYCERLNLDYPLPPELDKEAWLWSVVYDSVKMRVDHVKAYVRTPH